jgi:hypothetical protein
MPIVARAERLLKTRLMLGNRILGAAWSLVSS